MSCLAIRAENLVAIGAALLLVACSGGSGDPSLAAATTAPAPASTGMIQDRSFHSPEEALFVEKCAMCHRQFGMGTVLLARRVDPAMAMLEKRNDLTAEYVIHAARSGIGNMPRIPRGEVSDAQMTAIAKYLSKDMP